MKYKRILLKLSGEALMGKRQYGIDVTQLAVYAEDIKAAVDTGVQIAIVIGGGNIHRGVQGVSEGIGRVQGDYMGMLVTVINSLAMQGALQNVGIKCRLTGGLAIEPIVEATSGQRVTEYLEAGYVVLISGGTGNPFFTTDSAAALRAVEIGADLLLKATKVDGVYDADPKKKKDARRFEKLTYDEVIARDLQVMDTAAIALCRDYSIPLRIYDITRPGDLRRIVQGKAIGTLVHGRGL